MHENNSLFVCICEISDIFVCIEKFFIKNNRKIVTIIVTKSNCRGSYDYENIFGVKKNYNSLSFFNSIWYWLVFNLKSPVMLMHGLQGIFGEINFQDIITWALFHALEHVMNSEVTSSLTKFHSALER